MKKLVRNFHTMFEAMFCYLLCFVLFILKVLEKIENPEILMIRKNEHEKTKVAMANKLPIVRLLMEKKGHMQTLIVKICMAEVFLNFLSCR